MKMELEAAFLEPIAFLAPEVPTRRTTVRFHADIVTINPEPEYYSDEDVSTKWYSNQELALIKLLAKDLSNELRRSTCPQDATLTIAHRKTSLMLKSDFKALVKLSPSTPDQDLINWCSYTDGRRGLERFASRDYSLMRRNDIANTRQAVLEGVRTMQDAETIAHAAREASKRARTFARFFAAADADAAKNTIEASERRAPARSVSMRPGAFTTASGNTNTDGLDAGRRAPLNRRVPSRTASTFTKTKLPPIRSARGLPARCKSMRPAELAAPLQRCAPARKRSKQVHDGGDLLAMVR